jgi:hypothetical protein
MTSDGFYLLYRPTHGDCHLLDLLKSGFAKRQKTLLHSVSVFKLGCQPNWLNLLGCGTPTLSANSQAIPRDFYFAARAFPLLFPLCLMPPE